MACTACLVCMVTTVCEYHKNGLERGSASSEHITKLEQSTSLEIFMEDINSNIEKLLKTNFDVVLKSSLGSDSLFMNPFCKSAHSLLGS